MKRTCVLLLLELLVIMGTYGLCLKPDEVAPGVKRVRATDHQSGRTLTQTAEAAGINAVTAAVYIANVPAACRVATGSTSNTCHATCLTCEATPAARNRRACKCCKEGHFLSRTGSPRCEMCPVGSFSKAGASQCTTCATGFTTTKAGSKACDACLPGYAFTGCKICPKDTNFLGGPAARATKCVTCPKDKFTEGPGATSAGACKGASQYCSNVHPVYCVGGVRKYEPLLPDGANREAICCRSMASRVVVTLTVDKGLPREVPAVVSSFLHAAGIEPLATSRDCTTDTMIEELNRQVEEFAKDNSAEAAGFKEFVNSALSIAGVQGASYTVAGADREGFWTTPCYGDSPSAVCERYCWVGMGKPTATCQPDGTWSPFKGQCIPEGGEKLCKTSPPAVEGITWPALHSTGACQERWCIATCSDDFEPGYAAAVCNTEKGTWFVYRKCQPKKPPPPPVDIADKQCGQVPRDAWWNKVRINNAVWPFDCVNKNFGDICSAVCVGLGDPPTASCAPSKVWRDQVDWEMTSRGSCNGRFASGATCGNIHAGAANKTSFVCVEGGVLKRGVMDVSIEGLDHEQGFNTCCDRVAHLESHTCTNIFTDPTDCGSAGYKPGAEYIDVAQLRLNSPLMKGICCKK